MIGKNFFFEVFELFGSTWRKRWIFRLGGIVSLFVIFIGVFGPFIAPYKSEGWGIVTDEARSRGIQPPSFLHPFGTDIQGRDMFSRVLIGATIALIQIFLVLFLSVFIGLFVGIVAGYYSGIVEKILLYITEVFITLPPVLIAIVFAVIFPFRGIVTVIASLTFSWWSWYARMAYLQTRAIRKMDYVSISERMGMPTYYILFKHILLNISTPVIVQAITDMGSILLEASAINYLGLGVPPDFSDWGVLVERGRPFINSYWWISFFPGLFILLASVGFAIVGDVLREEIDPKLRRRWWLWF